MSKFHPGYQAPRCCIKTEQDCRPLQTYCWHQRGKSGSFTYQFNPIMLYGTTATLFPIYRNKFCSFQSLFLPLHFTINCSVWCYFIILIKKGPTRGQLALCIIMCCYSSVIINTIYQILKPILENTPTTTHDSLFNSPILSLAAWWLYRSAKCCS